MHRKDSELIAYLKLKACVTMSAMKCSSQISGVVILLPKKTNGLHLVLADCTVLNSTSGIMSNNPHPEMTPTLSLSLKESSQLRNIGRD